MFETLIVAFPFIFIAVASFCGVAICLYNISKHKQIKPTLATVIGVDFHGRNSYVVTYWIEIGENQHVCPTSIVNSDAAHSLRAGQQRFVAYDTKRNKIIPSPGDSMTYLVVSILTLVLGIGGTLSCL